MLRGENTWMENHQRVGETGISESGPSTQPLPYATNFFDQEGTAYFGELEEALMQGVVGIKNDEDKKSFLTNRPPPTLEIFPSWPMRFQQTCKENAQSAESTGSESSQNVVLQLESEQSSEPKNKQGQIMAAPNHELRLQDKKRQVGRSTAERNGKTLDAKTLRRLAQNREAARKSRLRKKAYVQNLESSRMRLAQLEQDLQRARSQGLFSGGSNCNGNISPGAAMFDLEYAQWLDDNYKHMLELRGGLQSRLPDGDLRVIVDDCLAHYDDIFRLKCIAARTDVFHLMSGMWITPAERCFIWMGGFRPSDLLKVLYCSYRNTVFSSVEKVSGVLKTWISGVSSQWEDPPNEKKVEGEILMPQLEPLTEQQLMGICNLQQSSQQAEEALFQGIEQLHQSLADTVAGGSLLEEDANVGNYMGQMAKALGKLANLEGFIRQADNLRQQTLHQLCHILTIRQSARCFLAIGEYYSRLRALSSLWASRLRENIIAEENTCPTITDAQIIHQHSQFSAF